MPALWIRTSIGGPSASAATAASTTRRRTEIGEGEVAPRRPRRLDLGPRRLGGGRFVRIDHPRSRIHRARETVRASARPIPAAAPVIDAMRLTRCFLREERVERSREMTARGDGKSVPPPERRLVAARVHRSRELDGDALRTGGKRSSSRQTLGGDADLRRACRCASARGGRP